MGYDWWVSLRESEKASEAGDKLIVVSDSAALLSTCAGAGATLVAIVGGLLVSRYLTLESQALGSKKLVHLLTEKLEDARERAKDSQRDHDRFLLHEILTDDDFLNDFLATVSSDGLSAAVVTKKVGDTDIATEVITEATGAFNSEAQRVLEFDWDVVPHSNDHAYWYEFAREHDIHPEIEEMWEYFYIELCKERQSTRGYFNGPVLDPATMGIVSLPEQNQLRDTHNRLIEARDADQAEIRRLESELSSAVRERDSMEQPPGLVAGLAVLALLTVTTVIIPVLLLAPTPATLTYPESVAVVGIFIGGIVVLFLYLGSHVHRLQSLRAAETEAPGRSS